MLAALMWTVVGAMLLLFGVRWLVETGGPLMWAWVALALTIGVAKAVFILSHTADRAIGRIVARGDGRCIGGFFSWRTWLAVATIEAR